MARAEIRTVFQRILGSDWKHEDQLENLYEMAVESGISAHDLGNKWESFTLNRQLPIMPTNTSLTAFKHGTYP